MHCFEQCLFPQVRAEPAPRRRMRIDPAPDCRITADHKQCGISGKTVIEFLNNGFTRGSTAGQVPDEQIRRNSPRTELTQICGPQHNPDFRVTCERCHEPCTSPGIE